VLVDEPNVGSGFVIFVPPTVVDPAEMKEAIKQAGSLFRRRKKPLLACIMGGQRFRGQLVSGGKFVPNYAFPEDAILALSKVAEYGESLQQPKGSIPRIKGIKRGRARRIIESALTRTVTRPLWLSAEEINGLLSAYGIRSVETSLARTAAKAASLAAKAGFPVVIKLASETIVHKTDVGGVRLNLKSKREVKSAFEDIEARLSKMGRRDEMTGVIVQPMVEGGVDAIIGVTQDPSFGPLIMFGLGGIYTELLKDVAVRLHPLTDVDAKELVSSIKMARLFRGFRGAPLSDTGALEGLLLRLSALVEDVPQIAELDFNPVKVMPQGEGYWVVDARIMLR
jgi:acetyltransferase